MPNTASLLDSRSTIRMHLEVTPFGGTIRDITSSWDYALRGTVRRHRQLFMNGMSIVTLENDER